MIKAKNLVLIIFLILPLFLLSPAKSDAISSDIVRLHIIANSDTPLDQHIKLKVRDAVLKEASKLSLEQGSAEQIEKNISALNDAAKVALLSYGSTLSVKTVFGIFPFPAKSYGSVTLPAGEYTALRVIIGEGKGQNWWCVMYPPLCFTDETTADFNKNDIDIITKSLPIKDRPKFVIKFKLLELLK